MAGDMYKWELDTERLKREAKEKLAVKDKEIACLKKHITTLEAPTPPRRWPPLGRMRRTRKE